jgi:hypothetical protein
MTWLDKVIDWLWREIAEMRQVRAAMFASVILAFGFGIVVAWWAAEKLYTERIAALTERNINLENIAEGKFPGPTRPGDQPRGPGVIALRILYGGTSVLALSTLVLAGQSRRLHRDNKDLLRRIDVLQTDAAGDRLKIEAISKQLEDTKVKFAERRRAYALETLRRYSQVRIRSVSGDIEPSVTVRYCSYARDYELAVKIRDLFAKETHWAVTLDGSNVPALPRAADFKVVFDIGMALMIYGDLVHAFSEGELIGVTVGQYAFTDRTDSQHVTVCVLPSAEA